MSRRIRSFDWSRTDLGPISAWPPALRTAVNIVLQSPLPSVLLWGRNGVIIYNDRYAVFAGKRHPQLLGSKVLEGWLEVAGFKAEVLQVGLAGGTLSFRDEELTLYRNNVPEQVFMDLNAAPVLGDDGQPAGVLAIVLETTTRVQAERQLAEHAETVAQANKRLSALVSATSDAMYRMSPDWREMRALQGMDFLADTVSPSIAWTDDYLFPEDQPHIWAAIEEAKREGKPFQLEHRVRRADGTAGWTLSRAVPVTDDKGEIIEWFGAASDVTARKEGEEHLRLVVNELNHRVKNTLTMIQGIATQTFRGAEDLEEAREKFTARLKALANANDVMTDRKWDSASIRDVVGSVIGAYCEAEPQRCEVSGPLIRLSPKRAISFSMALHELATNAVKYGAWSGDHGKVAITWAIGEGEGGQRLKLQWRESGGPPVAPPARRGFGSRLIERGLAAELGGEAKLLFEPSGLTCVLEAPLRAAARA